jgi:hypothetical protein
MTFEFKPATRQGVKLMIGLAGASGAGKTKSALELATGLAGPSGKIVFLDTEAKRGLHYAPAPGEDADSDAGAYVFHHVDLSPPFPPTRFTELVEQFAEADVIIIDSMSHEYDGEGSITDMANTAQEGIPKPGVENPRTKNSRQADWWKDWIQRPVDGPGAWKEPKRLHKEMMNKFLQSRAHLIFCLRAEEKIKMARDERTRKTVIEDAGWTPICEKRFMYEMTISFTLRPDDPGKPQYDLPHKIQDQHRHIFPAGQYISAESGHLLGVWADGGNLIGTPEPPSRIDEYAKQVATNIKRMSAQTLSEWWQETATYRDVLKIPADRIEKMQSAVDRTIGRSE